MRRGRLPPQECDAPVRRTDGRRRHRRGRRGRVRLENEDWSEPTLQERRAIIYAATNELAALTELLEILIQRLLITETRRSRRTRNP